MSAGGGGDLLGLDLNPVGCSSNTHVFAPSASALVSCSGNITAKYGVFKSPFEGTIFNFGGSAMVNAGVNAGIPFMNAEAVAGELNAPIDHINGLVDHGGGSATAEVQSFNNFTPSSNGNVQFMFSVTGSIASMGDVYAFAGLSFNDEQNVALSQAFNLTGSTLIQTVPVPFFRNVAFDYDWDLQAGVRLCSALIPACTIDHLDSSSAIVNFSDTIQLTGIRVTDSNGNPLTGVTFTSTDGVDYNALLNGSAGTSVPEPRTMLLVGAACIALAVGRRAAFNCRPQ